MKIASSLIEIGITKYLPKYDKRIYGLCKHYIDRYRGENNNDFHTNGELRLMHELLPKCQNVFDIGANVGNWSSLALSINSTLELHCFEPSQVTFQKLSTNPVLTHAFLNNIGLGSKRERRMLYIFGEASGLNSLYQRRGLERGWGISPPEQTEEVEIDTLDNYCQAHSINRIDFAKIDAEGHELEVLKGAKSLLSKDRIDVIQFEYGGCNIDSEILLKHVFEFLQPLGYAFLKIYPQELKLFEHYDQRLEDFQYQNWIAIKQGCNKIISMGSIGNL
jgi:FkbM family methyltransferase